MVLLCLVLLAPCPIFELSIALYQLAHGWSPTIDAWQQPISAILLVEFVVAVVASVVLELLLSEFASLVPKPGVPQLRWPNTCP